MCDKLADYLELPDDLFTLFLIDCAFGQETDMNFIKLYEIPYGKLRQGVEDRILQHYKFYMRKMGSCNNIMQHSPHLIPTLEWSNESFENAKFQSPSPSPMPLRTTDLISNFSYLNDKFFYDESLNGTVTVQDGIRLEETIDTITINDSTITIQDSTMDTIIIPDTQLTIVSTQDLETMQDSFNKSRIKYDEESLSCMMKKVESSMMKKDYQGVYLYGKKIFSLNDSTDDKETIDDIENEQPIDDKENIPPLDDSIPCGQPTENSTPLKEINGREFIDGLENAPIVKRKLASKEPLARRLFF